MVELGLIFYGVTSLLCAFMLGTHAERGNTAQGTLILLWAALWPVSIAFGVGLLIQHLARRRSA